MKKTLTIVMILFVVLSMFVVLTPQQTAASSSWTIKQLTMNDYDDILQEAARSLSWDGSKIVYSTEYTSTDYDLYAMNTTDQPGQEKLIANSPGRDQHGAINGDGSKIVFASNRGDPSDPWFHHEVFVINTTDSPGQEIQITNDNLLDHNPDISGNGKIVAWHSAPTSYTGFDIEVANISNMASISITTITTPQNEYGQDLHPSLTYDGELLCFWAGFTWSADGDLFVVNSDGTGLRKITTGRYPGRVSGDGSKVAFARKVAGNYEIFVFDITHNTTTQLTNNDADDLMGSINGDGSMVTYFRNGDIFVHDMTDEIQLTNDEYYDKYPQISWNGNVIAFMSNRDGPDSDIFVMTFMLDATVDIDPNTLNLKSNGQWVTAYITLPEGYSVEDIVLETVCLDGIPAEWSDIQDSVCMVKFDRATVQTCLTNEPDYDSAPKFYELTVTVTGELLDGTSFEGTDTITVIKK